MYNVHSEVMFHSVFMFAHILCRTIHSVQRTLPMIIGNVTIAMQCCSKLTKATIEHLPIR